MTPFANAQSLGGNGALMSPDDLFEAEQQHAIAEQEQTEKYWAAKPAREVVAELQAKEKAYFQFAERRGFTYMWRTIYAQHYGLDPEQIETWATQFINYDGEQGELLRFRVNETRSFTKQLVTMAIGNRPSFECAATNTDYDSVGQAEAADSIIEYIYYNCYGERKERRTVEKGTLYGLAWSWVGWDPSGGEEVMIDEPIMIQTPGGGLMPALDERTGKPLTRKVRSGKRTGDIVIRSLAPWEVFHEPTIEDVDDHLWRCVRDRRSKWEIASKYRHAAKSVLGLSNKDEYGLANLFGFDMQAANTDEIVVKHFYHGPSPAMAGALTDSGQDASRGRYIIYAGDVVLLDEPLPYSRIPLVDFCPAEYLGTSFGYADVWDLCSVNQMIDQLVSDIASNLATFGRQSVWIEEGTEYTADKIANGMGVLTGRVGARPPQAIQFAAVPESAKWFVDMLRKSVLQSLSGLNSVTRGDPDASITSGTMAALFHSIAIEFNSALQAAVDGHRERLANLILDILKQYAEHEMIAKISGADERPYLDTFTKDRLYGVSGVRVKTSNPMMRTQAGRMQIAELLLRLNQQTNGTIISDPGQLIEVIVSGQVKPMYDSPRKRRLQIKLENEMLQEGPQVRQVQPPPPPPLPNGFQPPPSPAYETVPTVPVNMLDNHQQHINEHYTLLTSREAMERPELRKAVLAHIQDHFRVWRETDPAVLIAMNLPLYPNQRPPGGPMPRPGNLEPPANDNGVPEALQPTDLPPSATGMDSTGVKLPVPARSPVPGNSGA